MISDTKTWNVKVASKTGLTDHSTTLVFKSCKKKLKYVDMNLRFQGLVKLNLETPCWLRSEEKDKLWQRHRFPPWNPSLGGPAIYAANNRGKGIGRERRPKIQFQHGWCDLAFHDSQDESAIFVFRLNIQNRFVCLFGAALVCCIFFGIIFSQFVGAFLLLVLFYHLEP